MKLRSKWFRFMKIIIPFLIMVLLIIFIINHDNDKSKDNVINKQEGEYYPTVEDITASISKYYIYGRSFNVEGVLDIQLNQDDIEDITLVLKTKEAVVKLKTNYAIEQKQIIFKTSDLINDGIILDDLEVGNFFLLLSIKLKSDESTKYYTFNQNDSLNLDYYTITKNNQNNYITISSTSINEEHFLMIKVVEKSLPDNVYDIVIDPGHGGIDTGATYKDRGEAPINLAVSYKVKLELEKLGLKVKLTRDGDYNPGGRSGGDQYGPGGRVSIPFEAKAKYMLSIHVNYDDDKAHKSGLELYMSNNASLGLARLLVKSILDSTAVKTSSNPAYKEEEGIYVRTLLNEDINSIKADAAKNEFAMYDIKQGTPYYFIIRETGGIATSAYVDGRNPKYSKNDYYDSNIGIETYILELGYINSDKDYEIVTSNQDGYANGISKAIENYLFK